MKSAFWGLFDRNVILILAILPGYSCSPNDNINPKPIIVVSEEFPLNGSKQLSGTVEGIESHLYNMVVYAKMNNGWYTMHDREFPTIPISNDYSWTCSLLINDYSELSQINIFLIPNGYAPPVLIGAKAIPWKMNLVAAAKNYITISNG